MLVCGALVTPPNMTDLPCKPVRERKRGEPFSNGAPEHRARISWNSINDYPHSVLVLLLYWPTSATTQRLCEETIDLEEGVALFRLNRWRGSHPNLQGAGWSRRSSRCSGQRTNRTEQ
jgi:hypothetical protein